MRAAWQLVALTCVAATCIAAQEPEGAERDGWMIGGSIGVPGYKTESTPDYFTVAAHWTQVRPGRLGADFWLGTVPRALVQGAFLLGARGGVVLPLALSPKLLLLPSGGGSVVGGLVVGGGVGGVIGFNAGITVVIPGATSSGLRAGVTWHHFADAEGAIWVGELGFVHRRRPR